VPAIYGQRNVTDKVPKAVRDEVKNAVRAAYYAPNRQVVEVNYYRLKAGSLEFRLRLRSSRLKDYAPKGGGFYHTPPSAV